MTVALSPDQFHVGKHEAPHLSGVGGSAGSCPACALQAERNLRKPVLPTPFAYKGKHAE